MLDRELFLRPTAHRGLHDHGRGVIENTWPAMQAAITKGFGIECDVQRTKDNVPIVFHDFTLDRLIDKQGRLAELDFSEIQDHTYKGRASERILTMDELLKRVQGRTPILIELKSDWRPPSVAWLTEVCRLAQRYPGPLALMSFDPELLTFAKKAVPKIPRGLISGNYRHPDHEPWWPDELTDRRARALTKLEPIDIVVPDFIAYHVRDLDSAPVQRARKHLDLPIFTWTVRSQGDWELCTKFADAAIFEGTPPDRV